MTWKKILKEKRICGHRTADDPFKGIYRYCTLPKGHDGPHNAEGTEKLPKAPLDENPFNKEPKPDFDYDAFLDID
tara:strand:+ start:481 stop:705 length:225 start_codon:yes stop_codon:yes gene_type:complete